MALKILSLPGLLLFMIGCVHENYDKCPPKTTDPNNVSLEFSLPDDKGNNAFDSNISAVDLGIYNDEGILVMTKHIPQTELAGFRGVKLTLDPGLYYVVSWGNIGDNAQHKGLDTPHSYGPHVTYNTISSGRVTDADKVHYAPKSGARISTGGPGPSGAYRMTVDPVTGHAGVLEFTPAYRTVNVYIEGYDGTPLMELLNAPEGLAWFGMKRLIDISDSKLMLTASNTMAEVKRENVCYDYAAFNTFYFDADNDIILNVVDYSTHEVVFSVTLNEALGETGFPPGIIISIVFTFTPAGVEIGVPHWESHEVDPGLGV